MISSQMIKMGFLAVALVVTGGCATDNLSQRPTASSTINLGDPDSERAHNVSAEHAPVVGEEYPDRWIMAARASDYEEGHEPWRAVDGDMDTHWQVRGRSPHPMHRGQWLDLELNEPMEIEEISIRWLGEQKYNYRVVHQPRSDATDLHEIHSGESEGQSEELETYVFPRPTRARSIRIEFAAGGDGEPRGIREMRVGGLDMPESYPLAGYEEASVVEIRRPFYVEFERFIGSWPQFNLKRPLADGGTARRIMNTDEFDGGYVDFEIAVDPDRQNWITLKLWESEPEMMTERGNLIALETFHDDPDRNRRWILPEYITEQKIWDREWYGLKPEPGRWVYASYLLHKDITEGQTRVHLRLQGIGNERRDQPMLAPAPPVYCIHSNSGAAPVIDCE